MSVIGPDLSIVVPCFNEQDNLEMLYQRLGLTLAESKIVWELVLVDDGSTDQTWVGIEALAVADTRVRGIRLARNFGHQAAVTAGIDHAKGRSAVIIDADLQDPPELILDMLDKQEEGYEVVYAQRKTRSGESFFKRWTAAAFYRVLRMITKVEIPVDTGDFRLLGPRALTAFRALPERNRFIRGLVAWVGFPQIAVEFERAPRHAGATNYPLRAMMRLATDAITGFSYVPLRLATWLGFAVSAWAFLYIVVVVAFKFLGINWLGYTSIMGSILFLGGVQLMMIGILGEYLGRIYDEVKARPIYLIGGNTDQSDEVLPPGR